MQENSKNQFKQCFLASAECLQVRRTGESVFPACSRARRRQENAAHLKKKKANGCIVFFFLALVNFGL